MKRHALTTRLWHWINAIALVILFMSGLNISNAHRLLYWGDYGFDPADAWFAVARFPGWMTLPQYYDLAAARDWHFLAAWVFAIGLAVMWLASLINGHFWRDIATSKSDWSVKTMVSELRDYINRRAESGEEYNRFQRIAYGLVLGILLPLMILTGLAMSPGFEVSMPWLVDFLGGRQSARSLHFIVSWALFGFFVIHLFMLVLSSPVRRLSDMITGGRRQDQSNG